MRTVDELADAIRSGMMLTDARGNFNPAPFNALDELLALARDGEALRLGEGEVSIAVSHDATQASVRAAQVVPPTAQAGLDSS